MRRFKKSSWWVFLLLFSLYGCAQFTPLGKGEKFFRAGNYSEAKKYFEKAVQQGQNVYLAKVYLGRIAAIEGDIKKAISLCEEARDLNPNLPDAYYYLGILYQFQQRFMDAEKALDKVAQIPGLGKGFALAPVQPPYGKDWGKPLKPERKAFYMEVIKGTAF